MKRLFQSLLRTEDGAFVIDGRHRIIFWNRSAQSILGYTAEEVAGLQCFEILGGRDDQGRTLCQRYCQIAQKAKCGELMPNKDVYTRTHSGDDRWLNVTTFAYPVDDRAIGQVVVHLFRDVTEQKKYQAFVNQVLSASERFRQEDNGRSIGVSGTAEPHVDGLTTREREVLELLSQGLGTAEIAEELIISLSTVRNHVQNILSKLGVHSRLEAIAHVYQYGLMENSANGLEE